MFLLPLSPETSRTGWFGSKEVGGRWRERNLLTGVLGDQEFISVIQFDLSYFAPGSRIQFAALEITGRDASNLGTNGEWIVDLIDPNTIKEIEPAFDAIRNAPSLTPLGEPLPSRAIATGVKKRIIISPTLLPVLEKQVDIGKITMRIRGPSNGRDNLFGWDAGPGTGEPTLYLLFAPVPFVVITNTPTPGSVFAAATLVAQQTLQARQFGTPTRLPRNLATATSAVNYYVITNTPTPPNAMVAKATFAYATAVAATTGTPTSIPATWVTATPIPLVIPRERLTAVPSPTPTQSRPSSQEMASKSIPPGFYNRILFLEGPHEAPNVWVMEPNGTIIGQLTNREVYDIAKARDTFSPDFCNLVYNKEDQRGVIQIWNQDLRYRAALPQQLSFIRNGYAFAPVWSPDYKRVAYVGVEGEQQDIFAWDWDDKKSWRLTRATDWWWNQFPSYSPDGKKIVYSSDQGHDATFSEIWIMDWDGANPRNMGNGVWNAYNPVWIKWHR
jgi:hypothetical protein